MEGVKVAGTARTISPFGETSVCNFAGRRSELSVMSTLRMILFGLLLAFAFAGPVAAASKCGDCPSQCGTDQTLPCAADCPAICAAPCQSGCIIAVLSAAPTVRLGAEGTLRFASRPALGGGFMAGPEPPPPRSAAHT